MSELQSAKIAQCAESVGTFCTIKRFGSKLDPDQTHPKLDLDVLGLDCRWESLMNNIKYFKRVSTVQKSIKLSA